MADNQTLNFTSHCRVGDIAIITEHEAAFKEIKLIQEIYEICETKHVSTETSNARFQNKSTQTDPRPKLTPLLRSCKTCKDSNHTTNNCSKKSTKIKESTIFRKCLKFSP